MTPNAESLIRELYECEGIAYDRKQPKRARLSSGLRAIDIRKALNMPLRWDIIWNRNGISGRSAVSPLCTMIERIQSDLEFSALLNPEPS